MAIRSAGTSEKTLVLSVSAYKAILAPVLKIDSKVYPILDNNSTAFICKSAHPPTRMI
jgi:hypothetical protein